ncbi:MAG: tRNA (N6-threonylcarbamoyladenosine(37)-N6)-methyltransferase TrmO [Leptolinea sp.]|jgi:tRNA-Thr(GGU) m(6)t(6)A37 methyltransferase TsaA|nr:tRNA (N6-threonylcarbamoyladenosine(37)-N6)-methyltransferase TrmO [Leptolinea sp.]
MTEFKPIGLIHTPNTDKSLTPIQSARSDLPGTVEVFSQYTEGLQGLEEFSHIFVFYEFHKSEKDIALLVNPYLDEKKHGLFATRFPCRPNPLGFSVVRLVTRKENILFISGADMLDGSPLLDIKPYIPEFDVFDATRTGWFKNRSVK